MIIVLALANKLIALVCTFKSYKKKISLITETLTRYRAQGQQQKIEFSRDWSSAMRI
jgi:hypothetical protein